ncbi:MAG: hypothetical protein K0S55_1475, partial [Clostridia bacterium]|nr:hypothetical protein [Clostridia bacterium]
MKMYRLSEKTRELAKNSLLGYWGK